MASGAPLARFQRCVVEDVVDVSVAVGNEVDAETDLRRASRQGVRGAHRVDDEGVIRVPVPDQVGAFVCHGPKAPTSIRTA